jgi:hypothetical protein
MIGAEPVGARLVREGVLKHSISAALGTDLQLENT